MPYAFTEQGISMLSAILRSDVAINVSIGIMRAFVEMRKFLATNSLILNRIDDLEVKQLEYQKSTDERLDKVFQYIEDHAESEQKVFFDGQIYDAFSLITSIIQKAQKEIILIDGYVDVDTLNVLVKKTQVLHDRFIILDGKTAYHIGASIKDAGKKCFGISLIDDLGVVGDLLNRLKTV